MIVLLNPILKKILQYKRGDFMKHPEEIYAVSFSGGKDSVLALDRAVNNGLNVRYLVNIYDESSERVRFHGFRKEVIQAQANALGLTLLQYPSTPDTFEEVFLSGLDKLKTLNITGIIFGNIHLTEVRKWFEERTTKHGFSHTEPLWGSNPGQLARDVLVRGYSAIITSIETDKVDRLWLGKPLDLPLIEELEKSGADPCGENGEYHSFVCKGPLFINPIKYHLGETRTYPQHSLVDIILDN